jgi:hypothetical protein
LFANRFTAFVDACTLANVLKRNLLLSLAEADFFRLRWSNCVLDETEGAIRRIATKKGSADPSGMAKRARSAMERAFEDATVTDYDPLLSAADVLPDPGDKHVLAAALKTQAAMIVTENLRHFPVEALSSLNIEAKSADQFIADTIALDPARAVAVIRRMRERFKRPEKTTEALLIDMEADGLVETVDLLRPHLESL